MSFKFGSFSLILLGLEIGLTFGKVFNEVLREIQLEIQAKKNGCSTCPHLNNETK